MTETDVNTTTEEDDLDPLDREALERAMKLASRDPGRRWQLNSKLQDESWFEVEPSQRTACNVKICI